MSKLHEAEDRTLQALNRLERVCQALGSGGRPEGPGDDERAALERDRERLLRETEALRSELKGLQAREDRLLAVVGDVEARVDGAIGQLDQIAGN